MAKKRGKRYAKAAALVEEDKEYQPEEAISLAKKTAGANFDETVEFHLRTGSDPRHADQLVRGVAVLPHGVGKQVRVVVFNLGYLPGGAKSIVTTSKNTMAALETAMDWLQFDGLLAVTAYRGHPGGMEEATEVERRVVGLPPEDFKVSIEKASTETTSPVTFFVRKVNASPR